jgi:hypothetical protein
LPAASVLVRVSMILGRRRRDLVVPADHKRGGGFRWRCDHLERRGAAAWCDGSGHPPDRALRRLLHDGRPELIEHEVATLVGQRVVAIALGYEDLIDHDELRHDPVLAVLAGKARPAAAIARRSPASRR